LIELVVDLAQHGDEALVVDLLFLGGERLAAAELFEHVVHAGEREAGMLLLLPLAVRVETLAEVADALFERGFFECGEWEGFEAAGFDVNGG
jgi:hypothetical protein